LKYIRVIPHPAYEELKIAQADSASLAEK
jgi:hypothetical protein